MKRIAALLMAAIMVFSLAACQSSTTKAEETSKTEETYKTGDVSKTEVASETETSDKPNYGVTLTLSTVDGSGYYLPFWIAEEKGWFKEYGINVEYLGFSGGPVQMEAYESWDLGTTGIGGVLNCCIGHDGTLLGVWNGDDSTQNFWAYNDSEIVKAGQGNNAISDTVYGTADTWKGATILSAYGDVKHYCIAKTLEGFGLTLDDVNMMWMDASSCLASFWGGTGDVVAVYSNANYSEDVVNNLTKVVSGPDMKLGLYGYLVANTDSLDSTEKGEAIKTAVELFYKAGDYIKESLAKGIGDPDCDYCLEQHKEYSLYVGREEQTMEQYYEILTKDTIYSLEDNAIWLTEKEEGADKEYLTNAILDLIEFYEEYEIWDKGSAEKFAKPEHFRYDIVKDIYAKNK